MLLPDTQIRLAQERIEERIRQAEEHKRNRQAHSERGQATPQARPQRSWLRQLLLGKV